MVSKRVLEKGVEKRSEKGHATGYGYFSCSPLKEHPRMGGKGHPNIPRDTPLVPKGTVADKSWSRVFSIMFSPAGPHGFMSCKLFSFR